MISPVASHSVVQEEYHSKGQDPQLQMPGFGKEKYGTKVQEDQSAADEGSEQIKIRSKRSKTFDFYGMLYGYLYCASRRRLCRGALSVTDW